MTYSDRSKFIGITPDGDDAELGIVAGGIFFTDVQPQTSGIVAKDYIPNTNNKAVSGFLTNTNFIRVTVEWDGTAHAFQGVAFITDGNNSYPVANVTQIGNTRRFTGFVDLNISALQETGEILRAIHDSGRTAEIIVEKVPPGPEILNVEFGVYPGTQTELKEGDIVQATFTFNQSDVSTLVLSDYGVSSSTVFSSLVLDQDNKVTLPITIANRGNTPQDLALRAVAYDAFGTPGPQFTSIETLTLNNQGPVFSYTGITYPSGQLALKNNENATVNLGITYFNDVIYTSDATPQLDIPNDSTYNPTKVVSRIDGDYNISTDNFFVTATRFANGKSASFSTIVQISNILPTIALATSSPRLRSGGTQGTSPQTYQVFLTSSQKLLTLPTLSAPVGSLFGFSGPLSQLSFTANITINDSHTKGVHTFTNLVATSLSGLVTNIISSGDQYTVAGFVRRALSFSAFAKSSLIGTPVFNPANLVVYNNSKGVNYFVSYKSLVAGNLILLANDEVDKYTLADAANLHQPNGNYLYNLDQPNRDSNASGTATFDIEEL